MINYLRVVLLEKMLHLKMAMESKHPVIVRFPFRSLVPSVSYSNLLQIFLMFFFFDTSAMLSCFVEYALLLSSGKSMAQNSSREETC